MNGLNEILKASMSATGVTLSGSLTPEQAHNFIDVIKEKNMYGKKVFGIERSTFVLDAQGNISREWRKVKAAGHAQAVLDALRETA